MHKQIFQESINDDSIIAEAKPLSVDKKPYFKSKKINFKKYWLMLVLLLLTLGMIGALFLVRQNSYNKSQASESTNCSIVKVTGGKAACFCLLDEKNKIKFLCNSMLECQQRVEECKAFDSQGQNATAQQNNSTSFSHQEKINIFQVWAEPMNAANPNCFGVSECFRNIQPGHIWSVSTNKDRIWDFNKTKNWVDYVASRRDLYNYVSLGDDVPTLQKSRMLPSEVLLLVGDDNRANNFEPCFGKKCEEEFLAGHCRQITNNTDFTVNIKENNYNFPNSICGNAKINLNFSVSDQDIGRYTLVVADYTGSVADRVDVLLNETKIGTIQTKVNTADWQLFNLNIKTAGKQQLSFVGKSGDGFGLDFIAIIPRVCNTNNPGFCLFTEKGINPDLADDFYFKILSYAHEKNIKLAIEPWAFPVRLVNQQDFEQGLTLDKERLEEWTNTFLFNDPAKDPDMIKLSLDALIYNYHLKLSEIIDLAKFLKQKYPKIKIMLDLSNIVRYFCSESVFETKIKTCDFTQLQSIKDNKQFFDLISFYGYDFLAFEGEKSLNAYRKNGYLDFTNILFNFGLDNICYQINPTEGNPGYHFDIKKDRTIKSLNSLFATNSVNCLEISGVNWGYTKTLMDPINQQIKNLY